MTDRKAPPSGDGKKSPESRLSDELFDRDYLTESDSEFLAELDRVLSEEESHSPHDQDSEVTQYAEPDHSPPPAARPEPDRGAGAVSLAADESTVLMTAGEEEAPQATRELGWEETPQDETQELNWEEPAREEIREPSWDEPKAEEERAFAAMSEPAVAEVQTAGTGPEAATAVPAEPGGPGWEELQELPVAEEPPATAPPDAERIEEPETTAPAASDLLERETPPREAAEAVPVAPSQAAGEPSGPPDSGSPAPAPRSDGGAWSGAVALLAALGLGVGGAAMWQVKGFEARLAERTAQVQPAPAPAAAQPAEMGAERPDAGLERLSAALEGLDARLTRLEERPPAAAGLPPATPPGTESPVQADTARLDALERELERIAGELGTLDAGLGERLDGQDGKLEAMRTDITELHNHLDGVQGHVSEAVKQLAAARQQLTRTGTAPAAAAPAPAATGKRGWAVNLASFAKKSRARAELERLRARDMQVELRTVSKDGKTWYRVTLPGFEDFAEAKAYAESIRGDADLSSAWVGRD